MEGLEFSKCWILSKFAKQNTSENLQALKIRENLGNLNFLEVWKFEELRLQNVRKFCNVKKF